MNGEWDYDHDKGALLYSLSKKRAYDHQDKVNIKLKMSPFYKEGFNEGFAECYALFNTMFGMALGQTGGVCDNNVLLYAFASVDAEMKKRNIGMPNSGDDNGGESE